MYDSKRFSPELGIRKEKQNETLPILSPTPSKRQGNKGNAITYPQSYPIHKF